MESLAASSAELPALKVIFALNALLVVVGAIILLRAAIQLYRNRSAGILRAAPARPNTLWPELIVIPMLVYLSISLLVGGLFGSGTDEDPLPADMNLLAGSMISTISGLACVLLAAKTFEGRAAAYLLGSRQIMSHVKLGVVGLLAAFPLCFATAELSIGLIHLFAPNYQPAEHEVLQLLRQPDIPNWIPPLSWITAVVIAPFAEEAFFRGVCQTGLNHLFKRRWVTVVTVGVIFGLAHASQPQVVLPLIVLGIALGYVYERSGSLVAPVTLHALFNLKTMVFFAVMNADIP